MSATETVVEDESSYFSFWGTTADGASGGPDLRRARTTLDSQLGELSVMWSKYPGRWITDQCDGGNAYIREGITTWGELGATIEMSSAAQHPGLFSSRLRPCWVSDDARRSYVELSLLGPHIVL